METVIYIELFLRFSPFSVLKSIFTLTKGINVTVCISQRRRLSDREIGGSYTEAGPLYVFLSCEQTFTPTNPVSGVRVRTKTSNLSILYAA